ncbi:MAG: hypothetical protein ABI564_07585, partial [Ideonella sp.]
AGVVLFQLLTGQRPFSGTMLSMALKVLNEPAPKPSSINPDVPASVDAVVARALQKKAADRFQTAGEFWQALAQAVGLAMPIQTGLPEVGSIGPHSRFDTSTFAISSSLLQATSSGPAESLPGSTASRPALTAAKSPTPSLAPKKRLPLWVMATIAVIVVGLAAWWSTAPKQSTPTESRPTGTPAPPPQPDQKPQPPSLPAEAPLPLRQKNPAVAPADPTPTAEPHRPTAAPTRPAQSIVKPPAQRRQPVESTANAPATVAPVARPVRPERCSDILLKASLEPLSNEESRFLRRECQ